MLKRMMEVLQSTMWVQQCTVCSAAAKHKLQSTLCVCAAKHRVCVCVFFFQHSFSEEKSCARLNMPKAVCWPPCTEGLVKNPPNTPEQALDAQKLRSKEEEKQQLAL